MEEHRWLETDYFDDFKCKCGDCRHPCCNGWRIGVGMDEYFQMIGRTVSNELRYRMDVSFMVPDYPCPEEYRYLAPNYEGKCHLLDDDGLCMLQKECGEFAIPEVCRIYPRNIKNESGQIYACCTASCEAVTEKLLVSTPLAIISKSHEGKAEFSEEFNQQEAAISSEVFFRLRDRTQSIQKRIGSICDYLGYETYEGATMEEALDMVSDFCELLSNESNELAELSESIQKKRKANLGHLMEGYEQDESYLTHHVPDLETWFENILTNNFFYSRAPFVDSRISPKEACAGLCMQYALLKLACIISAENDLSMEAFVDAISGVYHFIEHTSFYFNSKVVVKDKGRALILL